MDEITIRVPMHVKPDGHFSYKNLATKEKTYRARIMVGIPARPRALSKRFKTASQAREYGKAVCERYARLWDAKTELETEWHLI